METTDFVALLTGVVSGSIAILAYSVYFVRCRVLETRLPEAARYEDLSSRIKDLETRHDAIRGEVFSAEQKIKQAEALTARVDDLTEKIEQLKPKKLEYEKLAAQVRDLNNELKAKELQHKELSHKLEEVQKHYRQSQSQNAQLTGRTKGLRDETARLTKQLEQLKPKKLEYEKLEEQVRDFNSKLRAKELWHKELCRQYEEAQDRLLETQSEYGQLAGQAEGLREEIASLSRACETQTQMLEQQKLASVAEDSDPEEQMIWQPILSERVPQKNTSIGEEIALDRVENYLKGNGLEFPRRTLNAFHTALKVSPEAPLVVLAGISGTGKSQLPRHYAEALGMQFLSMAVQPGWDSPEDLLGFYNHLEGRFKATDLSRALVQMDPYGPDRVKEKLWPEAELYQAQQDGCLLVLLDEMNLARVEYYFSEFLSRLEQRTKILRGVIEEGKSHLHFGPMERQPAEIRFELGLGNGENQTLPVFISNNVLFCGTMNEDESTQSLSDKVLDRANVLRFAKPNTLKTHGVYTGSVESKGFFPHSRWLEWCKAPVWEHSIQQGVSGWIDQCNDGLQDIGRPFGHRLGRAINRYVMLYPDKSEEGRKRAMADQLEQRILPKLRGVDPSEDNVAKALRRLIDLSQELGDDALTKAIDQARKGSDGHYFSWQGVSRDS